MAEAKKRFPPGLDYAVALDTTLPVTEGIKEINHTFIEAVILVILVVFVFLQGWRATLIPLLAVPVSLIGTFAIFPVLGFSINTLSLFGLVLAIGLVVDDAIVVVEAVEHHIEAGLSPPDAAFKAMGQGSGPGGANSLILAAVFLPAGILPWHTGAMYSPASSAHDCRAASSPTRIRGTSSSTPSFRWPHRWIAPRPSTTSSTPSSRRRPASSTTRGWRASAC